MSYTNAQDLLRAAASAHGEFIESLGRLEPKPEGSVEAIRVAQLAERHRRVVDAVTPLLDGERSGAADASPWVQYDLELDGQEFAATKRPPASCDEAVAAGIELSSYFARVFEVAARQVAAPTAKASLADLAKLEEQIGKQASWAQHQNADIAAR